MKMRALILIIFSLWFSQHMEAQGPGVQWAGPDGATCGEKGDTLGIMPSSCTDCCYFWSPAAGLSCTDCPNPVARPQVNTRYKVVVTDKNLRWKESDEVLVEVVFGEMKFTPGHLIQGTNDPVHAELLKMNTSNIEWDLLPPQSLGCSLVQNGLTAIVTPGTLYGEVLVTAENLDVPGCIVRDTLPVNNGVKDIIATDPQHPNRSVKASSNDTLFLIGHGDVHIQAIPNEGGFAPGKPEWKPDTHGSNVPGQGAIHTMTETMSPFFSPADYIAGDSPEFDPKVTVVRKLAVTEEPPIGNAVQAFVDFILTLKDILEFKKEPGDPDIDENWEPPCQVIFDPFSVDIAAPALKYKITDVEKFNHPGKDLKKEWVVEGGITLEGRVYHPGLTRVWSLIVLPIDVCTELSAGITGSVMMNITAVKDPSSDNPNWKLEGPKMELAIGGNGKFKATALAFGYGVSGTASFNVVAKLEITFSNGDFIGKIKTSAAQVKTEAKAFLISDLGQYEEVGDLPSYEVNLLPEQEFPPFVIYSAY